MLQTKLTFDVVLKTFEKMMAQLDAIVHKSEAQERDAGIVIAEAEVKAREAQDAKARANRIKARLQDLME